MKVAITITAVIFLLAWRRAWPVVFWWLANEILKELLVVESTEW